MRRMNIRYLATVDGPKWTRSDAPLIQQAAPPNPAA